jgi:hypothetical protein
LKQGDEASVFLVVDKEAIKGNIIINKICETHRGFKKMIDEGRLERGTIICSKSVNTTQILDATQEDEEEAATRRCYIIGADSSQDDVGTWKDAVGAAKKVLKIMQKSGIQRTVITTIHGSSEQWRKAVECIASGRDVKIDINSNDVPKEEGWQQTGIRKKKPKTWETKRPTTEAIVVKTQGKPYAEMLKEVREKIDVGHIGVELTSVRKTKQGDLLMVVKKKEGVGEKLRLELGKKIDNVKVNSPKSGRTFIHVKDIDELSTEKEIIEALQKALNLKNDNELKITSIRPAYGCTQAATVMAPGDVAARMLQLSHVKIGLVQCRLRERVDVKKCYRCWMPGHLRKEYHGPERKGLCIKCGEEGHQSKDCQGEAYCTVCNREGHSAMGSQCPKYRKAMQQAVRKAAKESATQKETEERKVGWENYSDRKSELKAQEKSDLQKNEEEAGTSDARQEK